MTPQRIEIPVHFDQWMQGARFGTIVSEAPNQLKIRMDHPGIKRLLTIRGDDLNLCKYL